ncbi:hypothetical protein ACFVP3_39685 [Streptomyces sp. NPDC057806]|uniref:hypothetical protein n=1 Tax=Streptomyces sp. NPDC057806 TaxID=3346255 RepID=UPI0036A0959A
MGWYVIVPFSIVCQLTGLVQSLGTVWGLLPHYWVIAKLLITGVATLLLLVHMQPVGHLADAAARAALTGGELQGMRVQLIADAAAALLVLVTAAALSVFKPRGVTRYGRPPARADPTPALTPAAGGLGAGKGWPARPHRVDSPSSRGLDVPAQAVV